MEFDPAHLRALSAAVTEGTLDAAARALHITPSAVSQRLRALEVATGRVLLIRSKPVQVTESGEVVLRLARQVQLLTSEAAAELNPGTVARAHTLPLAINADSLGTWVLPALAPLAGDVTFDLHREDEEHTAALLRAGTVVAAITTDPNPIAGCSATRLGTMRYRPLASPGFAARWFPDGVTPDALAVAPVVVFDRKDDLQRRFLADHSSAGTAPPTHYVPSSADFLAAVRLGMGWGMLPTLQSTDDEARGDLVALDPRASVDVVLHWQQWKLRSPVLDRTAAAITEAARRLLAP